MIKYKLICEDCSHIFDSWFASSKEFEKLKKNKYLNCTACNSLNIDKSLMAPSVISKKNYLKLQDKEKDIKNKLREYKRFIKNNFEYVGKNFVYEARTIHYNNKKSKKGIYGNASLKEIKELKEEGIETEIIPWVNDQEN
ncbi:DUF1178 family protein [Candidatus Pelagibacter sp.]|nr:DUF1178 family protein [Candidatus Pelagibacter sp.]